MKKLGYSVICLFVACAVATGMPLWDDLLPGNSVLPPSAMVDPAISYDDAWAIRDALDLEYGQRIDSMRKNRFGEVWVLVIDRGGGVGFRYTMRKIAGHWRFVHVLGPMFY